MCVVDTKVKIGLRVTSKCELNEARAYAGESITGEFVSVHCALHARTYLSTLFKDRKDPYPLRTLRAAQALA